MRLKDILPISGLHFAIDSFVMKELHKLLRRPQQQSKCKEGETSPDMPVGKFSVPTSVHMSTDSLGWREAYICYRDHSSGDFAAHHTAQHPAPHFWLSSRLCHYRDALHHQSTAHDSESILEQKLPFLIFTRDR